MTPFHRLAVVLCCATIVAALAAPTARSVRGGGRAEAAAPLQRGVVTMRADRPVQQPRGAALAGRQLILKTTAHRGIPYVLDLADPRQRAYVLYALESGGMTRQRYPEIFRSVERARGSGRGTPRLPVLHPSFDHAALHAKTVVSRLRTVLGADFQANDARLVPINLLSNALSPNSPNYVAQGVYTQFGGAYRVVTMINLGTTPAGNGSLFAKGTYVSTVPFAKVVRAQLAATPPPNTTGVIANSLTLVYPTSSSQPIAFSASADDTVDPSGGCLQQPAYTHRSPAPTCMNPATATSSPVIVCFNRGGPNECDYSTTPPTPIPPGWPPNFVFPLKGYANYDNVSIAVDANQHPSGYEDITLIANSAGGGCVLNSSLIGATMNDFTVANAGGGTNNSITWSYQPAAFSRQNSCLTPGVLGYKVDLVANAYFVLTNSGFGQFTFTSQASPAPAQFPIPQIFVQDGCVAAGTTITMADGSQRPIESFASATGDVVMSAGGSRRITDTVKGHEPRLMDVIADDRGHTLKLTDAHPVFTGRGVIMAYEVVAGDTLTTRDGPTRVVSVRREPANGMVWNVRLGTDAEGAQNQTGMFANGILVGDLAMQDAFAHAAADRQPPALTPEQILHDTPARWRTDVESALADAARRP